jgi:hypothetical protein
MKGLTTSELELLRGYVFGKKIYDQVFPEFYDLIALEVERVLRPEFSLLEPDVGPRDKARAMTKLPHLGDKVPLDWVAFGFSGLDLYDYHIGVILLMENWPVKYHIGLHIMDPLWPFIQKEVETIDWKMRIGSDPAYTFQAPVHEHRFLDPTREINFSDLDCEIQHISERVIHFYRASAPVAANWAEQRKSLRNP